MEKIDDPIIFTSGKIDCPEHGISDDWVSFKDLGDGEDHFCTNCIREFLKKEIGSSPLAQVPVDGKSN